MDTPMEIFKSEDGKVQVNVRIEDDTAWLTQAAMAELFGCGSDNVVKHLKNIYEEGELQEKATTEIFSVVRNEGGRQVSRQLKHYNLDAIIAVGYRVNSARATQFRIWATKVLKEYIIKGFALNDERMKTGRNMTYFDELQERIREIRLSERVFYRRSRTSMRRVSTTIRRISGRSASSRSCRTSFCGRSAGRPPRNWSSIVRTRSCRSWA